MLKLRSLHLDVSIMFNMNISFVLHKDGILIRLYKITTHKDRSKIIWIQITIMELEEFASLQLDKPLPDIRVCNIYLSMFFTFLSFIHV